ncbi:MAG: hypothetical protein OEY16_11185, partial [Alphaproteobacteria bacterium]|nr:hypothetical protein [Alphaproteobacteria bacterium]
MSLTDSAKSADHFTPTASVLGFRFIGWTVVGTLFAYLFNVYLRFWREWPGARSAFGPDATMEAWVQALIYVVAI